MKWILLFAVTLVTCTAFSQSTLKIYVATDDVRADMDIIDLNTSALSRYGSSVDSTNIQYYSNMMSTQVIRVDAYLLFGEDDEPVVEMAEMTASMNDILLNDEPSDAKESIASPATEKRVTPDSSSDASESRRSEPSYSSSASSSASKVRAKSKKIKKRRIKRHKRYNSRCPRFF